VSSENLYAISARWVLKCVNNARKASSYTHEQSSISKVSFESRLAIFQGLIYENR